MDRGFKNLNVYTLAFRLASSIFKMSKEFPAEEKYELSSQIRRSSRSVCSNIAEGYRKRIYPKHFVSKMTDADSEASETSVWLDFALDCGYISIEDFRICTQQYEEVGKMLGSMINNPEKVQPKIQKVVFFLIPPLVLFSVAKLQ
jgi:four helix bundle protein